MTANLVNASWTPGPLHQWSEAVTVPPANSSNGCEQTHRTCQRCGLIKITMHPPHGIPWREWRTIAGMQVAITATPPCIVR